MNTTLTKVRKQTAQRNSCIRALRGIDKPEEAIVKAQKAMESAIMHIRYGIADGSDDVAQKLEAALAALTPKP